MAAQAIRPIEWRKFEKFVLDCGYEYKRQRGSHRVYKKADILRPVIVPVHNFDLPVTIILTNLRTMGITTEQYLDYLATHKKKRRPR